MTYKIRRVIHPIFNGAQMEAEVELTVGEYRTKGPNDDPSDDVRIGVEFTKVLWIADGEGNLLWQVGNGKPAVGQISPELGKVIMDEADKIEDLEEDKGE